MAKSEPTARVPHTIDVRAFCRGADVLQGAWPLAAMARLATSLHGVPDTTATWTASGFLRPVAGGEPEHWLHLQAHAVAPLQCQRCLQTYAQALQVDRRFLFVAHEKLAEKLDEELEDDVLAMPARLDLIALLEDEMILALPLVPRHEGPCPQPLPLPTDALEGEPPANPFAALAALRGRKGQEPGN